MAARKQQAIKIKGITNKAQKKQLQKLEDEAAGKTPKKKPAKSHIVIWPQKRKGI